MTILRTVATAFAVTLVAAGHLAASGLVGFYGIVERVVFEPDARSPERVQVWGAFAYADRDRSSGSAGSGMSPAERGYLYFNLPDRASGTTLEAEIERVRREWADLAAVAGTGQAVAFGRWNYFGPFDGLHPGRSDDGLPYILPSGAVRVRKSSEPPASPAPYFTNAGLVKLSDRGSHAAIVAHLRERLGTRTKARE